MHHPTLFNWRLTNIKFHAKSDSAFERAELQLLSDRMPSQLNAISIFYDSCRAVRISPFFKTTSHISVSHEQKSIKICIKTSQFLQYLYTEFQTNWSSYCRVIQKNQVQSLKKHPVYGCQPSYWQQNTPTLEGKTPTENLLLSRRKNLLLWSPSLLLLLLSR